MFHVKKEGEIAKYSVYRQGYLSLNPNEASHEHFRGFNEAVVDKITMEILERKQPELTKIFSVNSKEWEYLRPAYKTEMVILEMVISEVAENIGNSRDQVWEQWKTGLFSGKMLFLKEVEKTFGKGSLRILAAMRSATKSADVESMNKKIMQYFQSNSEEEKSILAKDILSERERLKYINRKKKL